MNKLFIYLLTLGVDICSHSNRSPARAATVTSRAKSFLTFGLFILARTAGWP